MKYRCEDCGAVFSPDHAETYKEIHRLDGQTFAENWAACPECMSTDLEIVEDCPICGEWTRAGACKDCRKDIRKPLDEVMEMSDTRRGKEAILDEIQNYVEGYQL